MQVAQHGDAVAPVHLGQRVHHQAGVARVEGGDRLVGEQDLGLLHEGAGDGDPLLLPARQAVGPLAGELAHVEALQGGEGHGPVLGGPLPEQGAIGRHVAEAPHQHVRHHVEAADEVELLEDHGAAGAPFPQGTAAQGRHLAAFVEDAPRTRVRQPVDEAQERRLAGARPADHPDEAAGLDPERHAVDGAPVAVLAREILDNQHATIRRGVAARKRRFHDDWMTYSERLYLPAQHLGYFDSRLNLRSAPGTPRSAGRGNPAAPGAGARGPSPTRRGASGGRRSPRGSGAGPAGRDCRRRSCRARRRG